MKLHVYPQEHLLERPEIGIYYSTTPSPINCKYIKSHPPDDCDYFVVPMKIKNHDAQEMMDFLLPQLKYYEQCPEKHIFFCTADQQPTVIHLLKSIVFKISVYETDTQFHCMYYNPIVKPISLTPISSAEYDVMFVGAISNELRKNMLKAVKESNMKSLLEEYLFWHSPRDQNVEAKITYEKKMHMAKFVLCPKGNCPQSVRFYESLCFGRIPIFISDGARLPMEYKIKYDDFIIRIAESELHLIEQKIDDFNHTHDLTETSKMCRNVWERYFSEDSFEWFIKQNINYTKLNLCLPN